MGKLRFTNLNMAGDLNLKAEIFLCARFKVSGLNVPSNMCGMRAGVAPRNRQQEHHETSRS